MLLDPITPFVIMWASPYLIWFVTSRLLYTRFLRTICRLPGAALRHLPEHSFLLRSLSTAVIGNANILFVLAFGSVFLGLGGVGRSLIKISSARALRDA